MVFGRDMGRTDRAGKDMGAGWMVLEKDCSAGSGPREDTGMANGANTRAGQTLGRQVGERHRQRDGRSWDSRGQGAKHWRRGLCR